MMKMTSRFMASPCALTACRQRSATPTGESIAARRPVALWAGGWVARGEMPQRCLAPARPAAHPPRSFSAHDGESGAQWRAVTAFTPPATDDALELFADHAIDGATAGAAE